MTTDDGCQDQTTSKEKLWTHRAVEPGGQREVAFANTGTHEKPIEPAWNFYCSLAKVDRAKFGALFLQLCQHGKISNQEKFHPSVGERSFQQGNKPKTIKISEFKIHSGPGLRIWAVLESNTMVLTHGAPKPKRLQLDAELDRACEIYRLDVNRRETDVKEEQ